MINVYDDNTKYIDILNRMKRNSPSSQIFLIAIMQNITNNYFYYFLCIFFRFIPLLFISGDYTSIFNENKSKKTFQNILKSFTCYNFIKNLNFSHKIYSMISILLIILLFIKIFLYFQYIKKVKNNYYTDEIPLLSKYLIILNHVSFLLFPYIIEYLSFSYYIIFFPNKFIIKINNTNKISLFIETVIHTLLIIIYNIQNICFICCINKNYSTNITEAYSKIKNEKNIKSSKKIIYKCSKLTFYIFIFFQNFSLISSVDIFLNKKNKIIFKIVISIVILLVVILLFSKRLHEFNFNYSMNIIINVLLLFCCFSIVFDFIIYLSKYEMESKADEILYVLIKFIFSYISYLLFILKTHKFLQSKIPEILFKERNVEKQKYFLNSFLYLNQIMLKIKEKNDINSVYLLIGIFDNHIYNCNKNLCNCKLLEPFVKIENFNNKDIEKIKNYVSELLIVLNHLFECPFIGYDYLKNYELAILLAEHFCHLRNNPTMSFAIISSLIINQRNKISSYEICVLYELSQKYIYFISGLEKMKLEEKKGRLINKEKRLFFHNFFLNLKIYIKIKKIMILYINNQVKIIKYKNIFEDSLKIQYDESNEYITSIKINFFEISSDIGGILDNSNKESSGKIKMNKKFNRKKNLYNILNLLKTEKFYYKNLLNYIHRLKGSKNISSLILFKFYLFFDLIEGGKFPIEITNKMKEFTKNKTNLYNDFITKNEFIKLKELYNEQNNKINSKYFAIFEYKNELRTKYFSEDCALKLGFNQKDLINEKLDILMPKEFFKSHKNMIKQLIIGNQLKYFHSNESFFFDFSSTVLYPVIINSLLIYNISKNLSIIFESSFLFENGYKFMLNDRFDLLANSKNFEDEYYLNQKIFLKYNMKIMDILRLKPEKLHKKFEKTIQKIHNEKLIRQTKTDEIFIPQFYLSSEEQINKMVNSYHFGSSKNKILLKILNSNDRVENSFEGTNTENDEEKKFINKKSINDAFIEPGQITYFDTYNIIFNKKIFIENLAKELTKISENDILFENDKFNINNLIIAAKQLNSELINKNDLSNHLIKVSIKFSYYYDKVFYFITIDDEKKLYINITKEIHFENDTTYINDKNEKKLKNKKNINFHKKISKEKVSIKVQSSKNNLSINNSDRDKCFDDKNEIKEKIDKYRIQINKNKFILIVKILLLIIIISLIVIYGLIINLQFNLIKITDLILLSHYFNISVRQTMLNAYSKLLETYFSFKGIFLNTISSTEVKYQKDYERLCKIIKENFHNFTQSFKEYSLNKGEKLNLLYTKRKFYAIEGFWEEIEYNSTYISEIETIVYYLYSVNFSQFMSNDINNFLFFTNQTNTHIRVETFFIKILYYFCANYEFVYKDIFIEIQNSLNSSFNNFINEKKYLFIALESSGLLFYLLFLFAVLIYLYYSNQIVIKNIVFLFLDFSEEKYDKMNSTRNNNVVIWKLLELKNLIDDFDLNSFQKYLKNLDKLNKNKNKNKLIFLSNRNLSSILSSDLDSGLPKEKKQDSNKLNQNKKNSNINKNNKSVYESKKISNKYNKVSNKNLNILIHDENNKKMLDNKSKGKMDNSSHNYFIEPGSNIFKDKLNNKYLNDESNEIMINNNIKNPNNNNNSNQIIDKNNNSNDSNKNNKDKVNSNIDVIESNENINDIIINNSSKTKILIIKIYIVIIFLIIITIFAFDLYKLGITFRFTGSLNYYFDDLLSLSNRYLLLFYYFNIFRTLLVFPKGERKTHFEYLCNNMRSHFDEENQKFLELISYRIDNYKETKKLFQILNDKNNDTSLAIKYLFLDLNDSIFYYVNSKNFDSGIDLSYKAFFNQINNMFLDYNKLFNKESIYEIEYRLINTYRLQFGSISQGLNLIYLYIQERILENFKIDSVNFKNSFINIITLLNLISVFISCFAFVFVNIIIFLTISNYIEPIKDSIYRINCSFYYIKKYSLNSLRNYESF